MQSRTNMVNVNTENIQEAKNELQNLGADMTGKTGFLQRKEALLSMHVENIAKHNRTWLERLRLPKEDKMMLKEYAEKQQEALNIVLTHQNESLSNICDGQVKFVKEVVNTLLKTGRAGLKGAADVLYMQLRNQRMVELQNVSNAFYNLMESKMADAANRPERLQEMKWREIEIDMKKWEGDYERLQDEFSNILQDQV